MNLSDIVLADAQATPVTHTFAPAGPDSNGVHWLVDRSQANAIGFWRISIEVRQPAQAAAGQNSAGRVYRVRVGLHEPVLETIGNASASGVLPAPTVAYIPRSFVEYVIPERTTSLDRANLFKMTNGLAANSQIQSLVQDLVTIS